MSKVIEKQGKRIIGAVTSLLSENMEAVLSAEAQVSACCLYDNRIAYFTGTG
jgi:hypothetical protein